VTGTACCWPGGTATPVVGDDHPVDEQLRQLAPLFEGGGGESGPDGLAERFDAIGHGLQFQALFSGGV
jgi:hypothetical protein